MGEHTPSIDEVMRRDDEFRATAAASACDPVAEASALREIFEGASSDLVQGACVRVLSAERWAKCSESWGKWKDGQGREVGSAVKSVVEELEADHLRPTGILGRLKQGVDPACHGLCALMGHLEAKLPASARK